MDRHWYIFYDTTRKWYYKSICLNIGEIEHDYIVEECDGDNIAEEILKAKRKEGYKQAPNFRKFANPNYEV